MSEAGLGHNNPPGPVPPDVSRVLADLKLRHPIAARLAELTKSAGDSPETLKDETQATDVQDLIRQMTTAKAQWKATRGVEKEPWATIADAVFGYFKTPEDTLDGWLKKLKPRHTKWLEDKAAEEEAAREALAKAERETAERALAEAAEAENRRLAAIEKEKEAEREKQRAIEAEENARWDKIWAEARVELAVYDAARATEAAEQERIRQAGLDAQAAADAAERDRKAAIGDQRAARGDARNARAVQETAARTETLSMGKAERSDARGERIERQLETATDADLSRTRSGMGTVGSLTGRWEKEVIDRGKIPLERLRGYLHPDAVDAAITLYMRDNRTEQGIAPLEGVKFHWVPDSRIT